MIKTILLRFILLPYVLVLGSVKQVTPGLYFLTPVEGDIVAGVVEVKGSVPDVNFSYAELSYSFAEAESSTWFLITKIDEPLHDGLLALWDTTTITDGTYRLKLTVHQGNNDIHEQILENIKVGNYSHFEATSMSTVSVLESQFTQMSMTSTPTQQVTPEPTPLPENPASIGKGDILFSLSSGIVLTGLIMGILGVYTFFRQKSRK